MYECELCNDIFDTKQHLNQHLNKKKKCNMETEFKCVKCNKFFRYKKTLMDHQIKNNSYLLV